MFKFKLDVMGRIATSAIAILLCACTVSLVTLGIRGLRPGLKVEKADEAPSLSSPAVLEETPDYGEFYADTIIFIGDTTLYPIKDSGVLPAGSETAQVWSDESGSLPLSASIDRTEIFIPSLEKSAYIADAVSEFKPEYLLLTVGLENGVRYCTEEQFKEYYTKLIVAIKEASPDTKIIVNSIFPVSKKYEKKTQGISMGKIKDANGWLVEIAEAQGVRYLDSISALTSSKGYLKPEYDSGDGLHMNAEGYAAFMSYVRTHGYKSTLVIDSE